jgi:hypothetical protein
MLHRLTSTVKHQQHVAHTVQRRRHAVQIAQIGTDRQGFTEPGESLVQLTNYLMGGSEMMQVDALAKPVAKFAIYRERLLQVGDRGRCLLGLELGKPEIRQADRFAALIAELAPNAERPFEMLYRKLELIVCAIGRTEDVEQPRDRRLVP